LHLCPFRLRTQINKKMKYLLFTILGYITIINGCTGQDILNSEPSITYYINDNVENSNEEYFLEIRKNWENYLNSNNYLQINNEYWDYDKYSNPEMGYASFLMYLRNLNQNGGKIQCSFIGIVPVQNDYYLLKTVFTEKNSKNIDVVQKVGNINYIVHPEHDFDRGDAIKMNNFNTELAKLFELPPISFDYVIANDTRDLCEIFGLDFFQYSYQPVASGGMADTHNNIIYAGNNSAYYPHEVVHLYTRAKCAQQFHSWVDEGIAALLGGSTGYAIEWHWEKLRRFLSENPNFKINNLTALQTNIPNGEYITDFRYAIGALICQRIIDKEGMKGIFEALHSGNTEDNYFEILEKKLNINRNEFEQYVKSEILQLKPINDVELKKFRY